MHLVTSTPKGEGRATHLIVSILKALERAAQEPDANRPDAGRTDEGDALLIAKLQRRFGTPESKGEDSGVE